MPTEKIDGLTISYEIHGEGRPWVITPGGRFSKDYPGVRELAVALAEKGNRVLIWDRPNCGESDVCFEGASESAMQADVLAELLRRVEMTPAVIAGGSGGARVSMLTAQRHKDVASGLAIWWISGGVYGLISLGTHYCGGSIAAAWHGGMQAVVELPEWEEVLRRNPANRDRFLALDPGQFVRVLEQWMVAYCPCGGELVPGLSEEDARRLDVPTLVLRSGTTDLHHRRETSEDIAKLLPNATLLEPPWGDSEWKVRSASGGSLFAGWPKLAEVLDPWARESLG
ncbi:MAG TPA: alpha/beta hydrolase [Acidimicrobiales bacterium]|nr:alpha/beta hydrolase [Acidimicrobiales bacterium]